ncbi:MAG: hypothetical protein ACRDNG_06625 [Gaiellaceae bacterium]
MERFIVTIEGPNWTDDDELELPRLPGEGELIETKLGTCTVTRSELVSDAGPYAGRIVCRFP